MKKIKIILIALFFILPSQSNSQRKKNKQKKENIENVSLSAFKFRNLGPSFLSGRISDISIHPDNENIWYVTAGSGGVWKTINAGNTWTPIFDNQASYSIGYVEIDPSNPNTIWIGTGEDVGGRHVGYGDGVYKSNDGGKTWKNMGLKSSEHISRVIVHPNNSDIVWVSAQGPLWNKGDQRGLYKSTDGGNNWRKVLGNSQWTGVTDVIIDPRNPDYMYAATWDRHRTVATYMGGGPGSGIHKSTDGGETWKKLTNGIPKTNLGKIGITLSPQNPDVIYAAIEEDRSKGGVYRSSDRGETWKKMSNAIAGSTGPHYYQEIFASPHKFDRIYIMGPAIQVSENGGKTFRNLEGSRQKHGDHHAIAFKKSDPDYILVGTDGGVYETFDLAQNWHYFLNLPLTQFYKVAVNNQQPFYHIFGGTQDNGSAGGPSASSESSGITNREWYKTLGSDGHQSATDPEFNNIIYATTQEGRFYRVDLTNGDQVFIQPQPREGEHIERYNWDTPIIISPHKASRIYIGSQRVWKSDNRGNDWTPISNDLTRNESRVELPIMGRKQSYDNAWDMKAMSEYNTITSLSESPIKEGLIWAGTDDGYIQLTSDSGITWKKIPVTKLGLPERTFVNDIKADLYDENTVYVSLDNHKEGDFSPYLFKSTDLGETWKSISSNIPDRTLIWRLVQDHIKKDLLFVASEFGIYTSLNGGDRWQKLPGTPTISFRDLVIQKRENDIVAASFGRGFFVLDDYSALREMNSTNLTKKGVLFKPRDAKLFKPRRTLGNTGGQYYVAKNPTFGAVFTYHLTNLPKTKKSIRKQKERMLNNQKKDVPFPGWEELANELNEKSARIILTISDSDGNHIQNVSKKASEGSGRIAWNLRHRSYYPVRSSSSRGGWGWNPSGPYVKPGSYVANLYLEKDGDVNKLDGPISFNVKMIFEGVLKGVSYNEYDSFRKRLSSLYGEMEKYEDAFSMIENKISLFEKASLQLNVFSENIIKEISDLKSKIHSAVIKYQGNPAKLEIMGDDNYTNQSDKPNISRRMSIAQQGLRTLYGPTGLHINNLEIAENMFSQIKKDIKELNSEIKELEKKINSLNPPYIMGQGID